MAVFSKPRKFYSLKEKANIIDANNQLRQTGRSINVACDAMGIQSKQYRDWSAKPWWIERRWLEGVALEGVVDKICTYSLVQSLRSLVR